MQQISDVSDAQLVTAVARYSEVALAEVYRRHGGAVYGLARRVLNNESEAQDVTQEVFFAPMEPARPLRPWPGNVACVPAGPIPCPGRGRHPLAQRAPRPRSQS